MKTNRGGGISIEWRSSARWMMVAAASLVALTGCGDGEEDQVCTISDIGGSAVITCSDDVSVRINQGFVGEDGVAGIPGACDQPGGLGGPGGPGGPPVFSQPLERTSCVVCEDVPGSHIEVCCTDGTSARISYGPQGISGPDGPPGPPC